MSARSCSTSRKPACIRAIPPACCPHHRSARCATRRSARSSANGEGARRGRSPQRAARSRRRRHLRARGQSARVANGSVRVEGNRSEPRGGCVPRHRRRSGGRARPVRGTVPGACLGEGGSASLRALPGCRPGARSRNACHRRGDGERRRLPTAFAKAERAAGRPLPVAGTAFLSVRDADKRVVVASPASWQSSGSNCSRPRALRIRSRRPGSRWSACAK